MKQTQTFITLTAALLLLLSGCALNYPKNPDAGLFIPLVTGDFEDPQADPSRNDGFCGSYCISRALEQEYFGNWLQSVPLRQCGSTSRQAADRDLLVEITKVLLPFEWQALEDGGSLYNELPGVVMFGRGTRVAGATLLSLRLALTPMESGRYQWGDVDLPYRFITLEDISMSDDATALMQGEARIYGDAEGKTVLRELGNGESIVLDMQQIQQELNQRESATAGNPEVSKPQFLPIRATRNFELALTDGVTHAPVQYSYPVQQDGYIKIVNLSHFPGQSRAYMSITRSLVLAQAGDCDSAFSIYQQMASRLDRDTRLQLLFIIAHLGGEAGRDVTAVLDALQDLALSETEVDFVQAYRSLNQANLRP